MSDREEVIKYAIERGFTYDMETGAIHGVQGTRITSISKNGYIQLTIFKGKKYYFLGHQLAWYWTYGNLPDMIDHIDMDKTNNRISNLRKTTKQINGLNTKADGVYYEKRTEKWIALICTPKRKQLGSFCKKEDAIIKYREYKKELLIKLNSEL